MGELNLYEEIQRAKKSKEELLNLIIRFTPMLKKYAACIRAEDAYNDLQLDFIELIMKLDFDKLQRKDNGALLSYIKKSVYNNAIKRSKIHCDYKKNNYFFAEMSEEQSVKVFASLSTVDRYELLNLMEYKKYLTSRELEIILLIFYFNYSVSDISKLKNISRQAVNQIKRKALAKLYKQLEV